MPYKLKIILICFSILVFLNAFVDTSFAIEKKRLNDQVNVLSSNEQTRIIQYHKALLKTHDIDYHVSIVQNTTDITIASQKLFSTANIGSLSTSGRGLLLLIDIDNNKLRLHVSAALEPIYTDAFVSYIQNRQMVPFFAASRVADGILATTEMIFTRAKNAEQNKEFMSPIKSFSTGAGAQTDANINNVTNGVRPYQQKKTQFTKSRYTALEVINLYHQAMRNRDSRPDLPIYSNQTKSFLKKWIVTPAQMDNLARTMKTCKRYRIMTAGNYTVIRYNINSRSCSPYFLHKENGNWVLDLATMSQAIRFNHKNAWRFDLNTKHPYYFAFKDIYLDKNGYPHKHKKTKKLLWGYRMQTDSQDRNFITWIKPSSHIEKIGIKIGDQVLTVNGTKIYRSGQFTNLLQKLPASAPVEFLILRSGQKIIIKNKAPKK